MDHLDLISLVETFIDSDDELIRSKILELARTVYRKNLTYRDCNELMNGSIKYRSLIFDSSTENKIRLLRIANLRLFLMTLY